MRTITLFFTFCLTIFSFGQKLDFNGDKMVSEITHKRYRQEKFGKNVYSDKTFKLTYNSNREIVKISVYDGNTPVASLTKRGNNVAFDEFDGYYKNKITLSSDGKRLLSNVVSIKDGRQKTVTYEYENGEFSGITMHYRGDIETYHLLFNKVSGNYYPMSENAFVYSDEVNDTNINLDCLTWRKFGIIDVNEDEYILLLPQLPLKSRNIVKEYEPDKASGLYTVEVQRDEMGNIHEILTKTKSGGIEVKLKYVP